MGQYINIGDQRIIKLCIVGLVLVFVTVDMERFLKDFCSKMGGFN